jgi:tetratricopeptide (TPR) repeat protein
MKKVNLYTLISMLIFSILLLTSCGKSTEDYINEGNAYYNLGEYQEAITSYKKAIEIDPENVDVYFALGDSEWRACNYPEALESYGKITVIDPGNMKGWAVFALHCALFDAMVCNF